MSGFPGDKVEDTATEDLRDELISLANRGKIKSTERALKKATMKQLEKIKAEYDRQQTEIVDELVSKYLIGGITSLMKSMEYIDEEEGEDMKSTLLANDFVKRDLGNLSWYITSNIKYIGIATMIAVAGGYIISKRYGQQTIPRTVVQQDPSEEERQDGE